MGKYRIHWLNGCVEEIDGTDIADAFRRAGYGSGAIRAVDYYEAIPEPQSVKEKGC